MPRSLRAAALPTALLVVLVAVFIVQTILTAFILLRIERPSAYAERAVPCARTLDAGAQTGCVEPIAGRRV